MWKNLPNFTEKPQRFEKMGPLIYDSMCMLPEYLYALLEKLVRSRKHTMNKEGVIEDDGSLSHNSDDRTSMGSIKELQLDETQLPEYLQQRVRKLSSAACTLSQKQANLISRRPNYLPRWVRWLESFGQLFSKVQREDGAAADAPLGTALHRLLTGELI
jgi:hypothetical protein